MKRRVKRYLAMLLVMAMVLQQGSTMGVLAGETEPSSETAVVSTAETQATEAVQKSDEKKEEAKEPETKVSETKPEEPKTPETKAPEQKPEEPKTAETQATEETKAETQTTETQAAEEPKDESQTTEEPATAEPESEAITEQLTESETVTEEPVEETAEPASEAETEKETKQETEAGPTLLNATCSNVNISVTAEPGALKAGTVLKATAVAADPVKAAVANTLDEDEWIDKMLAFDISLELNGVEVQPQGKVQVAFDNVPFKANAKDGSRLFVAHMPGSTDGVATISVAPGASAGLEMQDGLKIETTHFSPFAVGLLKKHAQNIQNDPNHNKDYDKWLTDPNQDLEGPYKPQNSFKFNEKWTDKKGVEHDYFDSAAFDFHIFARDVVIKNDGSGAQGNHTNGNIAAQTYVGSDYIGTNQNMTGADDVLEYNYFEQSVSDLKVNGGKTVLGNGIPWTVAGDGGENVSVSGSGNQSGKNFYQVENPNDKFIDFDAEFEKLQELSKALASKQPNVDKKALEVPEDQNSAMKIDLSSYEEGSVYYMNLSASDFKFGGAPRELKISGIENRTLIISVDMTGADANALTYLQSVIDGYTNGEDLVRSNCNLMWNFYQRDASGNISTYTTAENEYAAIGRDANYFMGTILAPGANVQYGAQNGSVIAQKTHAGGKESHNWRFTGLSASVTVWKKLEDSSGSTEAKTFTFGIFDENDVRIPDQRNQTVTVKPGESGSVTFSNLKPGTTYYVYEVGSDGKPIKNGGLTDDGYYVSGSGAVVIPPEATKADVHITNSKTKKEEGDLTVTKTVSGNVGDTSKAFNFKVELSDKTITGTYGDMIFTDGVAEFALKHGQSATATGLPANITYTVTEQEANQDGYVTKATGASGSITESGSATAAFVNTKNEIGSLKVTKTFGSDSDLDATNLTDEQKKAITFTVTGPNGYSRKFSYADMTNGVKTFGNLVPGEYTVTETNANIDGYNVTTTYDVTDGKTIVMNQETAEVTVTNTYAKKKGSLKIHKTVVKQEGIKVPTSFLFTVQDTKGNYYDASGKSWPEQKTIELMDGQTVEIPDLPLGEYTVTELKGDAPEGSTWRVEVNGEHTKTVTLQVTDDAVEGYKAETASFTNSYNKKDDASFRLKGTKKLVNGKKVGSFIADSYTFRIVQDPGDKLKVEMNQTDVKNGHTGSFEFGAISFKEAGTYTFKVSEVPGTDSNIVYDDTSYTVVVTIEPVKDTAGEITGVRIASVTCDGKTLTAGSDGDYELPKKTAEGLTPTVEASFINQVKKGALKIKKNVTVDGEPTTGTKADGEYTFKLTKKDDEKFEKTVTLTVKDGKSAEETLDDLDLGEYTVTEVTDGLSEKHMSLVDHKDGVTVEVKYSEGTAEVPTAEFTNNRTTLQIDKTDETTGTSLTGARLRIIDLADWTVAAGPWTTDGKPYDVTDKLKFGGSYILEELAAPEEYTIADPVEFTVSVDGKFIVDGKEVTTITMKDTKNEISILKVDESGAALANAKLIIKDADGNPVESWTTDGKPHEITGMKPGRYTLSELEAPKGYQVSKDVLFEVKGTETAEEMPITVTMEDQEIKETTRSLTVTKHLQLPTIEGFNGEIGLRNATFYVALFSDEEKTQRVSDVKKIEFRDAAVSSVTFTNLEADKTYYVGETDENGTLLPAVIPEGSDMIFYPEYGQTAQFKFEGSASTGVADFTNVYIDWPDDYYLAGQLTVTKKVLLNGVEHNSTDTFYARVFRDAALTTPASDVLTLNMAGSSTASATVTNLTIGYEPGSKMSYYVAETDANGVPLNPSAVEFEISVDKSEVVLSAENDSPEVVITNKFTEKEESESETEVEEAEAESESETEVSDKKTAPKTGDDTDFMKYLLLMALSAGLGAVAVGQKRRKAKRARK